MTDAIEKYLNGRKYTSLRGNRDTWKNTEEHPHLKDVQKIIHENIYEYWMTKGLEYSQNKTGLWNSKECIQNLFAAVEDQH